jgi:hypothetical protein
MKKKCLSCGSAALLCKVVITKMVPLADRNGTIKLGGLKVGQADAKNSWDKIGGHEQGPDQPLRGPIFCAECEAEHYYIVGDKNPLRLGSVEDARKYGVTEE